MKKISTYQQFNNERKINLESNQVNEEILSWLKKKAKNWLDNIRDINSGTPSQEDKIKQIEELSKIIPTEILNTIKDEVKKLSKSNESLEILFEGMFDALTGELKADSDFIKMSDEEKDEYLRQISQDKYFKFYPEGEDWTDGNYEHSEFQEFLLDKGIDVNRDIQVSYKPSIKNIETKIDGLDMSDSSKKALKIASITVLLLLLSSKAFAGLGDSSHGSDFGIKAGGYGKIGGDGDKKITQKDSEKKTDLGKISTTKAMFTTTEGSEKVNKLFNSSYLPKLMGAKTIEESAYGLTAKEFVEKLKMAYDNEKMLNDPQDGVLKFFKDNGIKPGNKDVKQYQEDLSKIKVSIETLFLIIKPIISVK